LEKARSFAGLLARWLTLASWLGVFALMASGCATPIGVNYVDPSVAYHSLTANVLSAERPSSFSARQLMNLNLYQRFEDDPVGALAELHAGCWRPGDSDQNRLQAPSHRWTVDGLRCGHR
jgi:hypothetical protein